MSKRLLAGLAAIVGVSLFLCLRVAYAFGCPAGQVPVRTGVGTTTCVAVAGSPNTVGSSVVQDGGLNVTGTATFNGGATVNALTVQDGGIISAGNASFSGGMTLTGGETFDAVAVQDGGISVAGQAKFANTVTATAPVVAVGAVFVDGGVTLNTGNVTVPAANSFLISTTPTLAQHSTTQQAVETFSALTLSAGTGTYTFSTAFSAAPVCTCQDTTAITIACRPSSTATTVVSITGLGTDVTQGICIGNK